jgi:hypothetical protein
VFNGLLRDSRKARAAAFFSSPASMAAGVPTLCPEYWRCRANVAIRPCRPTTFDGERLSRSIDVQSC